MLLGDGERDRLVEVDCFLFAVLGRPVRVGSGGTVCFPNVGFVVDGDEDFVFVCDIGFSSRSLIRWREL